MATNRYIRSGAYALLTSSDHIVLVQASQGPYQGMWNLPGGGIEFGEPPDVALRRELFEETGLTDIPDPVLVDHLSVTELHPEQVDTEMHLLGFLFRIELEERIPVKSDPDGNDSLGSSWVSYSELGKLKIGAFARRAVDRWIDERTGG